MWPLFRLIFQAQFVTPQTHLFGSSKPKSMIEYTAETERFPSVQFREISFTINGGTCISMGPFEKYVLCLYGRGDMPFILMVQHVHYWHSSEVLVPRMGVIKCQAFMEKQWLGSTVGAIVMLC